MNKAQSGQAGGWGEEERKEENSNLLRSNPVISDLDGIRADEFQLFAQNSYLLKETGI